MLMLAKRIIKVGFKNATYNDSSCQLLEDIMVQVGSNVEGKVLSDSDAI